MILQHNENIIFSPLYLLCYPFRYVLTFYCSVENDRNCVKKKCFPVFQNVWTRHHYYRHSGEKAEFLIEKL